MPLPTRPALTAITLLVLVTIIIDFSIPSGSVHGVPYVVLISLSLWITWRGAPYALALLVMGVLFLSLSILLFKKKLA